MDKRIKAKFLEVARRMVSNDRSATKGGYSNNLPGDITNAQVSAYKLGLAHAANPPETPKPTIYGEAVIWETVPPTSRSVLGYLTSSYSNRNIAATFEPDSLQQYIDEITERQRFAVVDAQGNPALSGRNFAQKGVRPLICDGLIEKHPDIEGRYTLTAKGDATCREYHLRSDRDDPTLPIQSMRG